MRSTQLFFFFFFVNVISEQLLMSLSSGGFDVSHGQRGFESQHTLMAKNEKAKVSKWGPLQNNEKFETGGALAKIASSLNQAIIKLFQIRQK